MACYGLFWSDPSGRLWGQPAVHEHLGRGLTLLIASPWRGSGPSDPSLSKVIGRPSRLGSVQNLGASKFAQRLRAISLAWTTARAFGLTR